MKKTTLSLLLALGLMVGMLAGCGSTAASEPAASAEASSAAEASEPAPVEEPEAPAEPEPETPEEPASAVEETPEEPVVALPEAYEPNEEHVDVTMLFQFPAFFQSFFPEGWGSSPWWDEMEAQTNTSWELREISNMAWQENVNLLCASGDLPDVVSNMGSVYNGGLPQAIRDEMIIDVAPLLEENAPFYYATISSDEYTVKTITDDDGQMGAMYATVKEVFPVTNGLWIRQDWLDELNMDIPTTPEEMKSVLEAFRDTFGADVGLYQMIRANTNQVFCAVEGVWNAFGSTDFYLDEDGNVQYGPMQDYYYDYLAFLKDLASEGLFLTSDMTDQTSANLFASGGIGVEGDMPDNVPAYIVLLPEEEQARIKLVPMAALGEPTELGAKTSIVSGDGGGNVSISTNCEDPAAVIHALDYLFTEDGAILSSYGIEDLSFTYNAQGEPELTELVLNNPDGIPSRAAMGYWMNPGVPGVIDQARGQVAWDDVQKSAYGIWESAYSGSSMSFPADALSLTSEEQDAISVYKTDMVTYATEWVNGVVFGDTALTDAEIQSFQATMRDTMHIDEIIQVYADAYERFLAR